VLPSLITGHALTWKPIQYTRQSAILEVLTVTPFVVDGDFNDDGFYNCLDVDALVGVIAASSHGPLFDLTGDGLVNQIDLTAWLAEAGDENLPSHNPYLPGDANLDGNVDGLDFVEWNSHKFAVVAAWCAGDFNANGVVDGLDFVVWNSHKFTSAASSVTVPEPASVTLLLTLAAIGLRCGGARLG
jgi:hypothetical protein